jgi:hypothetical protein
MSPGGLRIHPWLWVFTRWAAAAFGVRHRRLPRLSGFPRPGSRRLAAVSPKRPQQVASPTVCAGVPRPCRPCGMCATGETPVVQTVGLANRRPWRKATREREGPVDWPADGETCQNEAVCRRNVSAGMAERFRAFGRSPSGRRLCEASAKQSEPYGLSLLSPTEQRYRSVSSRSCRA